MTDASQGKSDERDPPHDELLFAFGGSWVRTHAWRFFVAATPWDGFDLNAYDLHERRDGKKQSQP